MSCKNTLWSALVNCHRQIQWYPIHNSHQHPPGTTCFTETRISFGGCCAIKYPTQAHVKPKSSKIWSQHNMHRSCSIVLNVSIYHNGICIYTTIYINGHSLCVIAEWLEHGNKTIFLLSDGYHIAELAFWWAYLYLDSKVHWANMGPTWVLSAPDGPHVGLMGLLSDT